jgi:hypothetical protein
MSEWENDLRIAERARANYERTGCYRGFSLDNLDDACCEDCSYDKCEYNPEYNP